MGKGGFFLAKSLTVGKSKTAAGTGRVIPLNPRAVAVLSHWRGLFAGAEPEHYVFPHEKYGLAGNDRKLCAYEIIPTEPMHRWKVAWESARKAANVLCRFHDLRQGREETDTHARGYWTWPFCNQWEPLGWE